MKQQGVPSSYKILPYYYIHVLDCNANITRVIIGPQTFIRQDHEQVTSGKDPLRMITIPKRHYCVIENPIVKGKDGLPTKDKYGQFQVLHGEREIRFHEQYQQPFPLYPKEVLIEQPTKLTIVREGSALKIEALRNFKDNEGKEIIAGEQYLFVGPATYYPRIEEKVLGQINAVTIKDNQALRLTALQELVDSGNVQRKTGEEWLMRQPGQYLPRVYEQIVQIVDAEILNDRRALQLRAVQGFEDVYGVQRKAGEEYLITSTRSTSHIVDVDEEVIGIVNLTILAPNQYCVIANPFDEETQKNKLGALVLVQGPRSFFLKPNEYLLNGTQDSYILSEDQALLLKAKEKFTSVTKKVNDKGQEIDETIDYEPGNKWMIYGPCIYTPPIEVEVLEHRRKIALDKNEGIYVRDTKTGQVRTVFGQSYMLQSHEELWSMELPENVEKQLIKQSFQASSAVREKFKVVSYRAPFNTAVQVYNYKTKTSRIAFGPDLVTLQPDEVFTQLSLSGQTPKVPGIVNTLHVMMGPEFSTDSITVETSDHAVLRLLLAYNWYFRVNKTNQEEASKIFAVKDFIGDLCNQMASKVRAAVASASFDLFHKTSARLIRKAIFGETEDGKIRKEFFIEKNYLVITNVDIKNVEPVDAQTRANLQRTVSLAIEISTQKQQAQATHQANQYEQEAEGELEQLKLQDELKAEEAKQKLLQMQNKSEEVKQQGVAVAEAEAQVKGEQIKALAELELSKLRSESSKIEKEAHLNQRIKKQELSIQYEQAKVELEILKQKSLSEIESKKFEQMVESLGQETLIAIANAGPELQAELLKGLGLQGYIFTDGNNPINLLNTANGLIPQH